MAPYWSQDFGNAASRTHRYGWRAEAAVELARERIAAALGAADPREIVFTSGATESDNLALQGVLAAHAGAGDHLVSVATEHAAVLDTLRALERRGARVTLLPVDGEGRVDPADVAKAIEPRTLLVSVGAANGEIGTLQPLAEIARVCAERDVLVPQRRGAGGGEDPARRGGARHRPALGARRTSSTGPRASARSTCGGAGAAARGCASSRCCSAAARSAGCARARCPCR